MLLRKSLGGFVGERDVAAKRLRNGVSDRLAIGDGGERIVEVVFGRCAALAAEGCVKIVDPTAIENLAGAVDDDRFGRDLGVDATGD